MVAPLAMLGLSVAGSVLSNVMNSKSTSAGGTASGGVAAPTGAAGRDKIKKTARDFESVFLEQSLNRLTENAGEDGPLGAGGTGGDVYRSMLVKEYAGKIVNSGGVGIADQVYRQMLQIQEGAARG